METSIDEVRSGFAFSEDSQIDYKCNELYMHIKMIACNLHNWFKQAILPEAERHHRIGTLHRTIYKVCGMITGNGGYRHIVFQTTAAFRKIIEHIQTGLSQFRLQYGTG